MYGQTEATARLSYLPPERLDDKLGSIGKGLPHTRLEVLRPDGTPVRPGHRRGGRNRRLPATTLRRAIGTTPRKPPVSSATASSTRATWRGSIAEGFLFLVERGRDFIKAMGNRVSPKEVEEVLAELPAGGRGGRHRRRRTKSGARR